MKWISLQPATCPELSMRNYLRVGMAQINPTVGDIEGNKELILDHIAKSRVQDVDVLLFPELALCGYPPEDLIYKDDFLDHCRSALREITEIVKGGYMTVCVGFPEKHKGEVFNSMAVLNFTGMVSTYQKEELPNYGVFDEARYFQPGTDNQICRVEHGRNDLLGLTICEDIWIESGPHLAQAAAGAEIILNISASPYHYEKGNERREMLASRAKTLGLPIAYCNAWGGQDELVFDGQSLVIDRYGNVVAQGKQFCDDFVMCDIDLDSGTIARSGEFGEIHPAVKSREEEIYQALVTGVRDYVHKNGFKEVILGLSGGVDSALVAMVAADAIGTDHVTAVIMPSPHSSGATQQDARDMAENLGIRSIEINIKDLMTGFDNALESQFYGLDDDVTEENIQARIRGVLLMALSNKFGSLLLSTGNKSEMAVGYATLYGDMAGGFAVIKDVPKTIVFDLINWRNGCDENPKIPWSIITRPPSAELRADQVDTDSLPPYDVLDDILEMYVEDDEPLTRIEAKHGNDVTRRVVRMVDTAEYKRRQAPPGVKITTRAFGRDRRLPITNRFKPF